jgi:hypothetical protein
MMDWSDRHYRYFMRQIAAHARLYTEMITTGALIHGDVERHLAFSADEHPVALQLGGSEPDELAHCAKLGAKFRFYHLDPWPGFKAGALNFGLKETDPRRFGRVRRRLKWITYQILARRGAAHYRHETRTCAIDFLEPSPEYPPEYLIGLYACTLVHEATHGEIRSRGVHYTPELRSRIEQLCVREEQRFVSRLKLSHPNLAAGLNPEFDASLWEWKWRATAADHFIAQTKRIFWSGNDRPEKSDRPRVRSRPL